MDGRGESTLFTARGVNLNQAEDTVLLAVYAARPMTVIRYGVMANSANGLLAANELRLRKTTAAGVTADLASTEDLDVASARARGVIVYKTLTTRIDLAAGDTLILASKVAAGGTSTGDVFIEAIEYPFAGSNIPSNAVAAA